jgi:hypothetical protein
MKFKNVSQKDLRIPGIGLVKSGEIKNMPKGFNNANFEKVVEKPKEIKKDNK